jgi:hypothetical protein
MGASAYDRCVVPQLLLNTTIMYPVCLMLLFIIIIIMDGLFSGVLVWCYCYGDVVGVGVLRVGVLDVCDLCLGVGVLDVGVLDTSRLLTCMDGWCWCWVDAGIEYAGFGSKFWNMLLMMFLEERINSIYWRWGGL